MTTPSTNSTPRQRRLPRRRPRAARGNAALPHRGSAPPASLSHGFRFQDFKTEVHETLPSFLELPIVEYRQSVRLDHGPDPLCPPHKTEIIGELQSLFVRHNAGAALSANAVFKPNKEFHIARNRINFEFNQLSDFQFQLFLPVVPVAASVKTKMGTGEE